jgi:outer membrane protein TolC
VELKSPARLDDYVVGGKLELSLRSYLDLVMANNTDIAIQRLTVDVAQNAITRAFARVRSAGYRQLQQHRAAHPIGRSATGASTLKQLSQPANFTYSQTLPTGLQYQVDFFALKLSTNSGYYYYNPSINSSLALNISQPLIKNRGEFINRLPIMVASSRLRKTEYDLKTSLLQLVSNAENAYWDAVLARENLRVAESARDLADQALKRAQRELELGALSPLDIYNPQQQYATSQIGVSQAQYALKQTEDALRRQIGADLDSKIRTLPIVLTETVGPEVDAPPIDAEKEVRKGLAARPDLKSAMQRSGHRRSRDQEAKNELLPDLELTGSYSTQGLGGIFYPSTQPSDGFRVSPGQPDSRRFRRRLEPDVRLRLPHVFLRADAAAADQESPGVGGHGGRPGGEKARRPERAHGAAAGAAGRADGGEPGGIQQRRHEAVGGGAGFFQEVHGSGAEEIRVGQQHHLLCAAGAGRAGNGRVERGAECGGLPAEPDESVAADGGFAGSAGDRGAVPASPGWCKRQRRPASPSRPISCKRP